jgi:peptide/nickel transport system substrate-binding protein
MRTTRRTILGATLATLAAGTHARAQPRRVLIIANDFDIPSFDPHTQTGYGVNMYMRNVYDPLLRVEGDPPKPTPHLARSWTVSPDGLDYVFKLDPAAKFHDGAKVTADDVIYSFQRLLRLKRGTAWMIAGVVGPDSLTAPDPETVHIRLLQPFAPFPQVLPWISIINSKLVEANKGTDSGETYLRTNIAGSGAFRLRRAEPGNLFEFEKLPDPWRQHGGNLNGFIWKIVRETTTQRLMIQRGEAHVALDLTAEDMDALKGRAGVVEIIRPEYRTFSIKMNTSHGPLADANVRRAVSYAFNYQAMLEAAGGYAKLMTGPLPDGVFGFNPDLPVYRTDLDKARAFLAKSSTPNGGFKLTAVYVAGLEQERRWCLVLLDSLRPLGIEVEVKPMQWTDFGTAVKSPDTTPDLSCVYQTANYGDPDNFLFAGYHSSRNGGWQNPVYKNPVVDALIEEGRRIAEPTARGEIYRKLQQTLVDDAPDLFGVLEERKIALRSDVQDYQFTPVAANAMDMFTLSLK